MRLIDADALKEKYTMVIKSYSGGIMERPAVLLETIDKAPTIDAVSVVRCKECIYWKNTLCQAWHRVIPKDGYCSIGERKGE